MELIVNNELIEEFINTKYGDVTTFLRQISLEEKEYKSLKSNKPNIVALFAIARCMSLGIDDLLIVKDNK